MEKEAHECNYEQKGVIWASKKEKKQERNITFGIQALWSSPCSNSTQWKVYHFQKDILCPYCFFRWVPQNIELFSGARKPPVHHFMVSYSDTTLLLLPQSIQLLWAYAFRFCLASIVSSVLVNFLISLLLHLKFN